MQKFSLKFELTPRSFRLKSFVSFFNRDLAVGRAAEDWQKKDTIKVYITFIFKLQDKVLALVEYCALGVSLFKIA